MRVGRIMSGRDKARLRARCKRHVELVERQG
jgi:hypothetical protein